jgi:nucleoside-diphosphate-sugar epimerase
VIGKGGHLQHWGLGRWHGAGAVRIWGHGRNLLPFVLIEDVSDALIRMMDAEGIVGDTFNLTGEPLFSARSYFDAIHAHLGARIVVKPGSPYRFYLADMTKYVLKRHALGKKDASFASLKDWRSRAHLSPFLNDKAKGRLGWQPTSDPAVFVEKAITGANLLGF